MLTQSTEKKLKCHMFLAVILLLSACGKSVEKQITEQLELGQKYLTEVRYEEALVAFQKVIDLEAKDLSAYTGLIRAYDGLNDGSQAIDLVQKGLQYVNDAKTKQEKEDFIIASINIIAKYSENSDFIPFFETLVNNYPQAIENEQIKQIMQEYTGFLIDRDIPANLQGLETMYQDGALEEQFQNILRNNAILEMRAQNKDQTTYYGNSTLLMPDGFGIAIYGEAVKDYTVLYIGEWRNGQRDGHGYSFFSNWNGREGYYIGEWREDIPNGKAKIHYISSGERYYELVGTAKNGYAEGVYQELNLNSTGNINGYEYYCKEGIPQSQGIGWVHGDEVEEDIMALLINENGKKEPVWHTWSGLRCKGCFEDIYENSLDFLNSFDHKWAGWGESEKRFTFIID